MVLKAEIIFHLALYRKKLQSLLCSKYPLTVLFLSLSLGTSLAVQWLGFHTSTAEGTGSIPGQGIKTPHAGN